MTKSEFKEVADEVFTELLPKVRTADRNEAVKTLITELQDRGFDIEDDEGDEEAEESDDLEA